MPAALGAQAITGRVVDAESRDPIAGAEVRLLDSAAVVVARELSNAEGGFAFGKLRPGGYQLEVEQFGYEARRTEPLELDEEGIRGLEVMLHPAAIPLEEIRVTSRLRRMRHEPTYAGLYARHATSPPMGNNRVILRTDPEFIATMSVRDLLYEFTPSMCEPLVFWHGFLVRPRAFARDFLEVSTAHVEGIEYYRNFASMPLSYRGDLAGVSPSTIRRCGVIAIWPRRSDPE